MDAAHVRAEPCDFPEQMGMSERYSLRVITPPPYEPISLAEGRRYIRMDDPISEEDRDGQNADAAGMIKAAREWYEDLTSTVLIRQTLEMSLDSWPCCGYIEIPRSPLISIDSIKYTDSDGVEQTWASTNYQTDIYSVPGRITLAYGGSVPSYRADLNSWRIRFTAGQVATAETEAGYQANVPERAKLAIKMHITGQDEGNLDEMLPAAESVAFQLRTGLGV